MVKLEGANFKEAELQDADLRRANLRGAHNLTAEQLGKARTLYEAKLDPELNEQIKQKYPHLLNEPKLEGKK